MFGNIGWGELVIIMIAALVILGPERLPGAMSWFARTIKQVRNYATGAQSQLKEELGPEFEDLRKPLSEIQQLRGMSPRAAITKHLLDGDDSIFTGEFDESPAAPGGVPGARSASPGAGAENTSGSPGMASGTSESADGAHGAGRTADAPAYDDDAT